MWRVLEGVDFLVAQVDVGVDEVLAEDVALGQEGVIGAQIFERLAQARRLFIQRTRAPKSVLSFSA
jgi:hypothetical protein